MSIARKKKILILDKGNGFNSKTHLAQGGIAAVFDWTADSFEFHAKDTMEAGRHKNRPEIVNKVVTSAPKAVITVVKSMLESKYHLC
ncbi:MAG TPA: FAD-binding protein [Lunatimonas sp.]|nr:FAD-binding protein [Lunatimonas sp.]